jgi:hypothetical protein
VLICYFDTETMLRNYFRNDFQFSKIIYFVCNNKKRARARARTVTSIRQLSLGKPKINFNFLYRKFIAFSSNIIIFINFIIVIVQTRRSSLRKISQKERISMT